jgi:hypothetical protein
MLPDTEAVGRTTISLPFGPDFDRCRDREDRGDGSRIVSRQKSSPRT